MKQFFFKDFQGCGNPVLTEVYFLYPPAQLIMHALLEPIGGHVGRVVTLSPPTSAAGVRSPSWP